MPALATSANRQEALDALERAVAALESLQREDGHFCGELEGDSILESEYLLMKFVLSQEDAPMADGRPGPAVLRRLAAHLRGLQREGGGWGQYPGSGADLSATVKAYFALKLVGDEPRSPHMQAAREVVLRHGGAERCNSFTNFYLACLGQISWNAVPAIPPEILLLPRFSYFHLTKVSAWTRTMIVPLSLVVTLRPTRRLPKALGIDELYRLDAERHRLTLLTGAPAHWAAFFRATDRLLKALHVVGGTPFRRSAIKAAEQWLLERAGQDGAAATDGLGAIFPPMVYIQIALAALGYARTHPARRRAERELDALFIEKGADGPIRVQPCFSPVWDTGLALYALADCGLDASRRSVDRAAAWLRGRESRHVGDWSANVAPGTRPAGWFFEYRNAWYPDVDDTAMVAMALRRAGGAESVAAAERGVEWMLAMQNRDGGWAAFDRTVHRRLLEYVPFADHNAMQDPSCPDITGRVLECLSWSGFSIADRPVARGVEFIRSRQEPEGCFFGRWGVNYLYGTWQSVVGPVRCGVDPAAPWIRRAGAWVKSVQRDDGSFGESANSYLDPSQRGRGEPTASQTAWGAMTLLAIFGAHDADVARAMSWLLETQISERSASIGSPDPGGDPAGSWRETAFTGTGFPRVFYLRYHLYRLYFPIMALGRWLGALGLGLGRPAAMKVEPKLLAPVRTAGTGATPAQGEPPTVWTRPMERTLPTGS